MAVFLHAPQTRRVLMHPLKTLTLINSVSRQHSGSPLAKWSTNSPCGAIGMPHRSLSEP